MKHLRNITIVTALALAPLGLAGVSSASSSPTTTVHISAAQYRADAKQINHTFTVSIKRAHTILKKALAAARFTTHPADVRLNALDAYQNAIIAATNVRESALSALGTPPPGVNGLTATLSP
jgi:hypothetical protein